MSKIKITRQQSIKPKWIKITTWVTLSCFGTQPILALAQATIAPTNGAVILNTNQGRPLVNIVAPNSAGVSHNQYNQFNVANKGIVLNNNNSGQTVTLQQKNAQGQADIAGSNPHLGANTAKVIINEVISKSPSLLQGYLEVAGKRADVIVANPNGITCNGCGFINTNRGTLTTGTPVFDANGNLDRLHVTGGVLNITDQGLIDFGTSQINLAAMQVLINGNIQGLQNNQTTTVNTLNVIGGTNDIDYTDPTHVTPINSPATSSAAIDVSQLGGMYAQQIMLISTAKGVGVNSAGVINSANNITVASDGSVSLSVATTNPATNQTSYGTANAQGSLSIQGYSTEATTSIDNSHGKLISGGALILKANSIDNTHGQLIAGDALSLKASGPINNTYGTLQSRNGTTLIAGNVDNTEGKIQDTGSGILTIHSGHLTNTTGAVISSTAGATDLTVDGDLNNSGLINSTAGNVTLSVNGNLNNSGSIIAGQPGQSQNTDITQTGGTFNNSGTIQASQDINIHLQGSQAQTNSATGLISAARDLTITQAHDFYNFGSRNPVPGSTQYGLYAGRNLTMSGGRLTNGNTTLDGHGYFHALNGGLLRAATGNVVLTLEQLINQVDSAIVSVTGDVIANNMLDSSNGHALINRGVIYGGRDVVLLSTPQLGQSTTLDNQGGLLSDGTTAVTPLIQAGRTVSLGRDCQLDSNGQCTVTSWQAPTGTVTVNNTGAIKSANDVTIQADIFHNSLPNPGITTTSSGHYHTNVENLSCSLNDVQTGDCSGRYTDNWTVSESFNNPPSILQPSIIANRNLTLHTQNGDNIGGTLAAANAFTLTALDPHQSSLFTNQALVIYSYAYHQQHNLSQFCILGICGADGVIGGLHHNILAATPTRTTLASIGGIIQAGSGTGSASITIGTFNNNGSTDANLLPSSAANPNPQPSQLPNVSATPGPNTVAFNISNPSSFDPSQQTNAFFQQFPLPIGSNGLFTLTSSNLSGRYLIESNPIYGLPQSNINSDYLVDAITANNAQLANLRTQIHLGDANYEQRLIQDQILARTGMAYLGSATNTENQLQALMDNAISQASAIPGMILGMPLTEEQQKQLTSDIVWMVSMNVSGQDVLVPQLYLSPSTQAAIAGGQVIAGNIDLKVDTLNNTGGNIQANGSAQAGDGRLTINAGTVNNTSATLQATGDLAITADTINNTTVIRREGDTENYQDAAGKVGLIKGGRDVTLKTTGDLNIQGAQITSTEGSVNADVGGKTQIQSLVLESKQSTHSREKSGFLSLSSKTSSTTATHQTALTAGISAAKDVKISSTGDLTLTGAAIKAGENVALQSTNGNYTDNALYLKDTYSASSSSNNVSVNFGNGGINTNLSTSKDNTSVYAKTGIASTISAGNAVSIGGKNVAIEGGIYSGKTGHIEAAEGGNVTFSAIENVRSISKTSSSASSTVNAESILNAKTKTKTSDKSSSNENVTYSNGLMAFKDGLDIVAKDSNDPNAAPSKVDIGGVDIASQGKVAITGGQVTATKYQNSLTMSESSDTNVFNAKSVIKTDDLLKSSMGSNFQHNDKGTTTTRTADNINAISANDIQINATQGDVNLRGVNLSAIQDNTGAKGDITINSDKGDVKISAAQQHITTTTTSNGFGAGVAIDPILQQITDLPNTSINPPSMGDTPNLGSFSDVTKSPDTAINKALNTITDTTEKLRKDTEGMLASAGKAFSGIADASPIGFNISHSESQDTSGTHTNSSLAADGNIKITAKKGNIALTGVDAVAGNDATLEAGKSLTSNVYEDISTHSEKSTYLGLAGGNTSGENDPDAFKSNPTGMLNKNINSDMTVQSGNTIIAKNALTLTAKDDVTLAGGTYYGDTGSITSTDGNVITKTAQTIAHSTAEQSGLENVASVKMGIGGASVNLTYGSIDGVTAEATLPSYLQKQKEATDPSKQQALLAAGFGSDDATKVLNNVGNANNPNGGASFKLSQGADPIEGNTIASAKFGVELTHNKTASTDITNTNADILFGKSMSINAAKGNVDIGGANIQSMQSSGSDSTLDITAQQIQTTKYEDVHRTDIDNNSTFMGTSVKVESSLAGVANDVSDNAKSIVDTAKKLQDDQKAITSLISGNKPTDVIKTIKNTANTLEKTATNVKNAVETIKSAVENIKEGIEKIMGENTLSVTTNSGIQNTQTTQHSRSTAENINQITADNIHFKSTQGDITLAGVKMQADDTNGQITLDSAKDLNIKAAKNTTYSTTETTTGGVSAGMEINTSINPSKLNPSDLLQKLDGNANAGYKGNGKKTVINETTYQNSEISGADITLRSKNDTQLMGGRVEGSNVNQEISGNLVVQDAQNTRDNYTTTSSSQATIQANFDGKGNVNPNAGSSSLGKARTDNNAINNAPSGIFIKEKQTDSSSPSDLLDVIPNTPWSGSQNNNTNNNVSSTSNSSQPSDNTSPAPSNKQPMQAPTAGEPVQAIKTGTSNETSASTPNNNQPTVTPQAIPTMSSNNGINQLNTASGKVRIDPNDTKALAILKNNPNITQIMAIDPKTGNEFVLYTNPNTPATPSSAPTTP